MAQEAEVRLPTPRIGQLTHALQWRRYTALRCSAIADLPSRYEMGRQPANTKISSNVSVRRVRVRGGNFKFRALRLDAGNFSWGSEVQPAAPLTGLLPTSTCFPCRTLSCCSDVKNRRGGGV